MKRTRSDETNFDLGLGEVDFNFGIFEEEEKESVAPKRKKEEATQVISDTLKAFKERAKNEQKRFEKATDSEYWFCVCFQTREEKESFLKNSGLIEYGDKYLDGRDVGEILKVPFERDLSGFPKQVIDKKLAGFV